jgi:hypothetical protein
MRLAPGYVAAATFDDYRVSLSTTPQPRLQGPPPPLTVVPCRTPCASRAMPLGVRTRAVRASEEGAQHGLDAVVLSLEIVPDAFAPPNGVVP